MPVLTHAATAPGIVTQPSASAVLVGQTATFSVTTTGSLPQSFQWYQGGNPIAGATSSTLVIPAVTNSSAGDYSVVVTNIIGSATSNAATLTVIAAVPPTFAAPLPATMSLNYGDVLSFVASMNGSPPFAFQWFHNGVAIPQATNASYGVYAKSTDAGTYMVQVTNAAGVVVSNIAQVTVASAAPATITLQPASQSVQANTFGITFNVAASGTAPLTYQWYKNGTAITGATATSLNLSYVQPGDAGTYTVIVTNPAGSVTSNGAILTVGAAAPVNLLLIGITNEAEISRTALGGLYTASAVTPSPTLGLPQSTSFVQWYHNGQPVPGAISSSLQINAVSATDTGEYFVATSTAGGTVVAPPNLLTMTTPAYPGNAKAWIDAQQQGAIIYFLFASPAQVLRYDTGAGTWLAPVSLAQTPTAMRVSAEGVYVAFGQTTVRYSLDLTTMTTLATTANSTASIFLNGTYVYLLGINTSAFGVFTALHRSDGTAAATTTGTSYTSAVTKVIISPSTGNAYGWNNLSYPSILSRFVLNADGTVGNPIPAPFKQGSSGTALIASSDGSLLLADNGVIYNASDLSYHAALAAGNCDDLCILGDGRPVALRGNQLYIYDATTFSELGTLTIGSSALKVVAQGSTILVFTPPAAQGGAVSVTSVTEAQLLAAPLTTATAIAPNAASTLSFVPSDALMDKDGLIYLMDRLVQNILVWSPSQRAYVSTIPLSGTPDKMAYSSTLHRLYVSYADRRITRIDLATSTSEQPFTTAPAAIMNLVAVDDQLYAHLSDSSDSNDYRDLYSASGQLLASISASGSFSFNSYWNSPKQLLYGDESTALNAVPIQTGAFGTVIQGPSTLPPWPLRFSSDGSLLVTGTGAIYNATNFGSVAALPGSLTDATWLGSTLYSLNLAGFGSQIQGWSGAAYAMTSTTAVTGYPLRVWTLPGNQLIALTVLGGGPVFTVLDGSGNILSQDANTGQPNVPPVITAFTYADQGLTPGSSTTLSVTAIGPSLSYQWTFNGANIAGATQSTYAVSNFQSANGGIYRVVISNAYGSATSPAVQLYILPAVPAAYVTSYTPAQTAVAGDTVSFSLTAVGANLTYQWRFNGVAIPGATSSTLTLTNVQPVSDGTYSAVIYNSAGSGTLFSGSNLTVVLNPNAPSGGTAAPQITTQPASQAVLAGTTATFTVGATGIPAPTYQWTFNGVAIPGATSSTYTLTNVQAANVGNYAVTVTNASGSVTSQAASLTLATTSGDGAPVIVSQPRSYTTNAGGTVVFTVNASTGQVSSGSGFDRKIESVSTVSYQWYFNGVALADGTGISGSQAATLVVGGIAVQAGSYACLISNSSGSVMSQAATLTVSTTKDIGRLINISCRAQVGTASNILIAGFVVGGQGTTGSESILARGSGPALVPYGVTGTLPDPQLQLYSTSAVLGTNNGWAGNAQIAATAAALGASPWTDTSSHDSAMLLPLNGGAYSAQIAGQGGDTGVALAELYDATPSGTYTPATPRLVNISARVQVGTGGNILIAGFVIGGSTSRTLLIRAAGPALIPYGVPGTLPDPKLQLYSGSTVLAANNGWGGSAQISSAAASVGAFAWPNPASSDSAILITLPPGVYSAQVSGASGDTGVALVEVYEVP
jgi:hypothetical protein